MNFAGQKVLVVGGSGVLGAQFINQLVASGASVIGTASSETSLARIPDSATAKYVLDLTDSKSIQSLVSQLTQISEKLSGVILASGVVGFSTAETTSAADAQKIMSINFLGQSELVNSLFPLLKPEDGGESFILGISGVVVEQAFPGMSAYSSSKAALSMYLQTIGKEWRRYKIKVTEARLGHTETGLATRAEFGTAPQMPTGLDPETVVRTMLDAVAEKKPILTSADFI